MKSFILFPTEQGVWDDCQYPVVNLLTKWHALYNDAQNNQNSLVLAPATQVV